MNWQWWSVSFTHPLESHALDRPDHIHRLALGSPVAQLYVMKHLGMVKIRILNDVKKYWNSPDSICFRRPAWLLPCGVIMFAGFAIPFERFPLDIGIGGGGAI